MAIIRASRLGVFIFLVFGRLFARVSSSSPSSFCSPISITDSILRSRDFCSNFDSAAGAFVGVTEGDDVSLQKVLNLVHKNSHDYVAVLFYASWCSFSRTCRPTFGAMSSLYPSIIHFAFEESVVKPSILSRYGVHGFPTLFLFNSTMRVRYHGSRNLTSLVDFYSDVTGMKPVSLDRTSLERIGSQTNLANYEDTEEENCPFSWARSPGKLLQQETYLALATAFVILRLLYFFLPSLLECASAAWRRLIRNTRIVSLWEYPSTLFNQAMQIFRTFNEPCKRRSNLQERAIHARTWAHKSFAPVSISDAASSSRVCAGSEVR
ncbi:hypothetical protein C5167_027082 [Papaver somniferum]|uniref:5'-adenylylsulfate reductase-like 4 n=1 Tax=Papaver somniferum TaxID=3469 RepID=UPI000E70501A|nr:5'-adenylylsulfate reductase-like 4 [Papaver somniferum]RZC89539.1 hypothetical protein C5167_027082 [Papaver somniferum]